MAAYEAFQKECQAMEELDDSEEVEEEEAILSRREEVVDVGNSIKIAKYPPAPGQHLARIQDLHNAPGFSTALTTFINDLQPQELHLNRRELARTWLPFDRLDVYHKVRFKPCEISEGKEESDVVKAVPGAAREGQKNRFDPVIVLENNDAESTGLTGE